MLYKLSTQSYESKSHNRINVKNELNIVSKN